jgi:MFS family permease
VEEQVSQKAPGMRRLFSSEVVVMLVVICLVWFSGEILWPVLSLYMDSKGLDAGTIGLMSTIMMVGIASGEFFWGWLIDRVELIVITIIGTIVFGTIIGLLHITRPLLLFTIIIFSYGFFRAPVFVIGRWFMGMYAPSDIKTQAMALLTTVTRLVASISGFASGYCVEIFGYTNTIWLSAASALMAGTVIITSWRWLDFKSHRQKQRNVSIEGNQNLLSGRTNKLFTIFVGLFGFFHCITYSTISTYMPLFANKTIGVETWQIGVLFGIVGIITTIFMMPIGRLADKVGKWGFLPVALGLDGLSMLRIASSGSYGMLVTGIILYALATSIYFPVSASILSDKIPAGRSGTAMGTLGLMEDVGLISGAAVGGILWGSWSIRGPFLFAATITIVGIPLMLFVKRWLAKEDKAVLVQEVRIIP